MYSYSEHSNQWSILRAFVNKNDKEKSSITELHLIHKQTQLLNQINSIINLNHDHFVETHSLLKTQLLSSMDRSNSRWLQIGSSIKPHNRSKSSDIKNMKKSSMMLQRKQTNEEQLINALVEVRQKCSQQSYEIIERRVYTDVMNTHQYYQRLIEKQINTNRDLKSTLIKLTQQKQILKNQLEQSLTVIQTHQQERKKFKKLSSDNYTKQNYLLKLETVLLKKQKSQSQFKKKIEKKQLQMAQERELFQKIITQLQDSLQQQQVISQNNNHLNQITSDYSKRKNIKKPQTLANRCQKLLNKYYDYFSSKLDSDEDNLEQSFNTSFVTNT